MVQLVFVHGVATRAGEDYSREVASRNALFQTIAFKGRSLSLANAYWGKDASNPAWANGSLPRFGQSVESFSLLGGLGYAGEGAGNSRTLAEIARTSFGAAVDALFVVVVEAAEGQGRPMSGPELALFDAAAEYVTRNPAPGWVTPGLTDDAFVAELRQRIGEPGPTTFGMSDFLRDAARELSGRARNLISTGLTKAFRDELSPTVGRFLGDVFVYLKDSGQRDRIREDVRSEIIKAHHRRTGGEALVLVGHSMGGVILVDLLSDPAAGLADIPVDLLLTVGSQPGFFEEMKLFTTSDPAAGAGRASPKAARLRTVEEWWNVFDIVDLLSFRCEPIFDGVTDYQFSSATGLLDAHTSYFKRPSFHQRLRARVSERVLT